MTRGALVRALLIRILLAYLAGVLAAPALFVFSALQGGSSEALGLVTSLTAIFAALLGLPLLGVASLLAIVVPRPIARLPLPCTLLLMLPALGAYLAWLGHGMFAGVSRIVVLVSLVSAAIAFVGQMWQRPLDLDRTRP
ncbi:hypothetical protein [Sphingomonas jatrophae]|uniref:Uncharacterized protein n=1 Tax=Sphingomonas jatrophae TaxID=1166337 RepID=A0A1I6LP09_9SPHN|nr:hypothetical protein [Sphingomonas jatrophae]SFS05139.1 hypothetical protein SAMN05192580_3056 [Sphingomonas jatrophae]